MHKNSIFLSFFAITLETLLKFSLNAQGTLHTISLFGLQILEFFKL